MTLIDRPAYPLQVNELYQTPSWVTRALLRHFPVEWCKIWDPVAGNHAMADVLADHGADVVTSDIQTYRRQHDFIADFLDPWIETPTDLDGIVMNPPFGAQNRLAAQFAALALEKCDGIVAMLCTAKFDSGKTRHKLFRDNARFAAKIVLVDRISWFGNDDGGTEDHAWYVWCKRYDPNSYGPTIFYEGNDMDQFNVNQPIGKWATDPARYLDQGWYELSPQRGCWFFRRRDPVIVTDEYGKRPTLCHVNFLTRGGVIMCENRFNGFAFPAIGPNADRVWPLDLFHPFGARYSDGD